MIRLLDGVFTWSSFDPERKINFNGFVLSGSGGCVVVDPPPLSDDDGAYLERAALRPELVVVTNRNHLRGWKWWADRFRAPLAMHEAEVGEVDVPVARKLADGETFGPGLAAVHLPGKSPGEIGLHWKSRGILLLGDALIAPLGALKLVPEAKQDDPALLRRSLKARLPGLSFETLLLADGDPLLGGARAAVDAFLSSLP